MGRSGPGMPYKFRSNLNQIWVYSDYGTAQIRARKHPSHLCSESVNFRLVYKFFGKYKNGWSNVEKWTERDGKNSTRFNPSYISHIKKKLSRNKQVHSLVSVTTWP